MFDNRTEAEASEPADASAGASASADKNSTTTKKESASLTEDQLKNLSENMSATSATASKNSSFK